MSRCNHCVIFVGLEIHTHTCTHTHTYTHKYTHTHADTYTHVHTVAQ